MHLTPDFATMKRRSRCFAFLEQGSVPPPRMRTQDTSRQQSGRRSVLFFTMNYPRDVCMPKFSVGCLPWLLCLLVYVHVGRYCKRKSSVERYLQSLVGVLSALCPVGDTRDTSSTSEVGRRLGDVCTMTLPVLCPGLTRFHQVPSVRCRPLTSR